MTHVFGPVPSRRLGHSLGVDLLPFKTCTYDCIYCQLGRTTNKTLARKQYVPLSDVLADVKRKLEDGVKADYITLSGSGEPTLFSELGPLVTSLKSMTDVPIAVLTNGSLLWDEEVRRALLPVDLVVPSLDASDAAMFEYVNRPCRGISFERMVEGLVRFRQEFARPIWLEVMLLGGVTSGEQEAQALMAHINRIQPDKVQLNTVVRPPAEAFARPVSPARMEELANLFGSRAEVVTDFREAHQEPEAAAKREDVLDLLRRRPCSIGDVASGLDIHRNEAVKHVQHLMEEGAVTTHTKDSTVFYVVTQDETARL